MNNFSTDIVFLALVNQAAKQSLGMVYNVRSGISECRISIVSKCHNPSIRYVEWKEVFEPESIRLVVCPGVLPVSVQAMNRDNTGVECVSKYNGMKGSDVERLTQPRSAQPSRRLLMDRGLVSPCQRPSRVSL